MVAVAASVMLLEQEIQHFSLQASISADIRQPIEIFAEEEKIKSLLSMKNDAISIKLYSSTEKDAFL